jgi:hypothetical protein
MCTYGDDDDDCIWVRDLAVPVHIGLNTKALLTSLFLHEGLCKIHTPFTPLFHQENITAKYQFGSNIGDIFLCLYAPFFQFGVSWSSEMQFGMLYIKTWSSIQPCVSFWTFEFCSFLFLVEHA